MGSATARLLALHGARVSVADYELEKPGDIHNGDATKASGKIVAYSVDVRNEEEVKQWIEKTVNAFGKLDGCVNFAGVVSKDFLHVCLAKPYP